MTTTAKRVEKWVWVAIYGGLVLLGLGLAVQGSDAALGWGICAVGTAGILAGALLIWLRSRMKN